MTHKENITAILECYFPGFKEEIIESACNRILEQEPCEDFKRKAGVVIEQLRADRDRLEKELEEIRAEIDRQKKWLLHKTTYNVDIALDAIKSVAAEGKEGGKNEVSEM